MNFVVQVIIYFMNRITDNTGTEIKDKSNLGQKVLVRNVHLSRCSSHKKMLWVWSTRRKIHPKHEHTQFWK